MQAADIPYCWNRQRNRLSRGDNERGMPKPTHLVPGQIELSLSAIDDDSPCLPSWETGELPPVPRHRKRKPRPALRRDRSAARGYYIQLAYAQRRAREAQGVVYSSPVRW